MKAAMPAAVVLVILLAALYPQLSNGTRSACRALEIQFGAPGRDLSRRYGPVPEDAACWLTYWRLAIDPEIPANDSLAGSGPDSGSGDTLHISGGEAQDNPPPNPAPVQPAPEPPAPSVPPPGGDVFGGVFGGDGGFIQPAPPPVAPPPVAPPRPPAPPPTYRTSFDCDRASSRVERTICGDRDLAQLDLRMAGLYQSAMSNVVDRNALRGEQLDWLALQRDACINANCLRAVYNQRIAQLRQWTGR